MISDDEGLREEYISREEIFKGRILHVVRDTVRLPDGKPATREFCLHVGGVAVLPLLPDGRVIVERQVRYPLGRATIEIPAGKLNYAGEDREEAARRELFEESGAVEYEIKPLCDYWAGSEDGQSGACGVVFTVDIHRLGALPESEMAETRRFERLPENMTYPEITAAIMAHWAKR